jgi:hypothetical protein
MQKRKLTALLIAVILLGLMVSACGVAVGQVQVVGGPSVLSPQSTNFSLSSLLGIEAPVAPSLQSVSLTNPVVAGMQAAAQAQSVLNYAHHAGGCNGGGGYYNEAFNLSDD